VAFARALIADPRILVLDEATSNVDLHTEGRIEAGLRRLLAGRTAIVIAHRLSTIRQAARSSSWITAGSSSAARTRSYWLGRRLRRAVPRVGGAGGGLTARRGAAPARSRPRSLRPAAATVTGAMTAQQAQAAQDAQQAQQRTALFSVVAAAGLVAIKLVTSLLTGSLGLLAEAMHSGTDFVAALLTFYAVRVAVRPPDRDHPFGHGKAEHLSALGEAAFLVLVSVSSSSRRSAGWCTRAATRWTPPGTRSRSSSWSSRSTPAAW
jgi:hypothetical protein